LELALLLLLLRETTLSLLLVRLLLWPNIRALLLLGVKLRLLLLWGVLLWRTTLFWLLARLLRINTLLRLQRRWLLIVSLSRLLGLLSFVTTLLSSSIPPLLVFLWLLRIRIRLLLRLLSSVNLLSMLLPSTPPLLVQLRFLSIHLLSMLLSSMPPSISRLRRLLLLPL
jgi:hypothetical protein